MSKRPPDLPPRDVCFLIFPFQPEGETCLFLTVADDHANFWRAMGWHVLARDSEMSQPPEIEPSQSNPHRKD